MDVIFSIVLFSVIILFVLLECFISFEQLCSQRICPAYHVLCQRAMDSLLKEKTVTQAEFNLQTLCPLPESFSSEVSGLESGSAL